MATTESLQRRLTARAVDGACAADTVRHIDQLSERTQQRFYEFVDSDSSGLALSDTDLEVGEIVVFTDYYRIERP